MNRRKLAHIGWGVAALLAAAVVVQAFVLGVYRVDSGSMEPTLHGPAAGGRGESVLVLYDRGAELARFDLAVLMREGEDEPVVKRAAGLSGESVLISGGDLLIDGKRLAPNAPRPPLVPIFAWPPDPLDEGFPALEQSGRSEGEAWLLRAGDAACVPFGVRASDGFRDAEGHWVAGITEVNDLALRVQFRMPESGSRLRVWMTEEGDRFVAEVERVDAVRVAVRLLRSSNGAAETPLAALDVAVAADAWAELVLENVDNQVVCELDRTRVAHGYPANEPLRGAPDPIARHLEPRIGIEVPSGAVALRSLAVLRDLYYTQAGRFGVDSPLQLGPGEYFVLGDHSAESRDSRFWGPVRQADVMARPEAVVWPLRQARRLR